MAQKVCINGPAELLGWAGDMAWICHTQIAWLAQLQFLYPEKYVEIVHEVVGKIHSDVQNELLYMQGIGQADVK